MTEDMYKEKIMISIRKDYLREIDALVDKGAAPNRSALIQKVISSFLRDLKAKKTNQNTALGGFAGFLIALLGAAVIADILGGE